MSESTEFPPREPGETMATYATRALRTAILEGRLTAGARIGQEWVAEALGVSRIPVRDALRNLESEGLVRLSPNVSARVADMDLQEFVEVYLMRERLEPLAIEHSAANLTDADIAELEEHCREFERAVMPRHGSRDLERALSSDREFHLASIKAAGMPRLQRLVQDFWNSSQHFRRAYMGVATPIDREVVIAEHSLLIDALRHRDGERAGTLLRQHIRYTRVALIRHLSATGQPQEFSSDD
ncbi:GntR family transcriptional regulator [Actinomadura coerulea]|uniref:GntR family transcriptional regulator n=1 Tax=Actinomadura coerulea TaxID=46159 RepID=UPI0034423D86